MVVEQAVTRFGHDAVADDHPERGAGQPGAWAYESLSRKGEIMTTAAKAATYAHEQIDQGRTDLNAVSKIDAT